MYVINDSTIEPLVESFREYEESYGTRIDEDALDAYVHWFMENYSEFEDIDEAYDEFTNEMWAAVTPEYWSRWSSL